MSKVDCRRRLRNQIPVSFLNKFVVHVLLLKDQDGLMLMVKFEWNLNEISRKFGRNALPTWEKAILLLWLAIKIFLGGFSCKEKCELISSMYFIKHL